MPTPKTPTERELKTRIERCQRKARRHGRDVSRSRRFGTYQMAYFDGSNMETFATLEELEQRLNLPAPSQLPPLPSDVSS
jgi:hypothetical protein